MYIFFFNDTATTEIYTLSLHDALPIFKAGVGSDEIAALLPAAEEFGFGSEMEAFGLQFAHGLGLGLHERPIISRDRKSTRLNSSHANISYAVFCLKKKHKYISLFSLHL